MSEYTANAGHGPEICVGIMEADENGKVTMPPQYAYKIEFSDKDCLVIPLDENNKKKAVNKKTTQANKEDMAL